jgi:dTDP-4-amino-4,6-dideoxygalactose transaminase
MNELRNIASQHRLALIEDCAQAHGATFDGVPVGGLGDVGAFSLNATKALAGPEGGLLTTDSDEILNRAARMRVFGTEWRDGKRIIRDADSLGYNYRTNELAAAFALARLESFNAEQEVRAANAQRLIDGIRDLPGISVPPTLTDREHVFQMIRVRVDANRLNYCGAAEELRDKIVAALTAEGAQWWAWERKPLPAYSLFQSRNAEGGHYPWCLPQVRGDITYRPEDYPVSLATAQDSLFTTAHYPPNGALLMDLYIEAFRKVWSELDVVVNLPLPVINAGVQEPF